MNSENNELPEGNLDVPLQNAPEASNDDQAESEAAAFAFGMDLESHQTRNKFRRLSREDAVDGTASFILRAFMVTAGFVVICAFLVLFWHYLAPEQYTYLNEERVSRLKELLLSGSVGAALASIGKSSLIKKPD